MELAWRRVDESNVDDHAVTLALIEAMADAARAAGARFLVVGVSPDAATEATLAELRERGIAADSIAPAALELDTYDRAHPGPDDHRVFAERLQRLLPIAH